ncbi:RICIN domain-containing protein [Actinomadura soli]|uniref:RICIN domain-containing protein n=1 Tax=Actinomadura soli TaxID=2508997 RepID=A0A5C4J3M3_9ACTN|nr:RICIN domain-containing protein [Actinomadura soli]TMQ90128.1 RICIN domain-containing protein [Actinomadura soli]
MTQQITERSPIPTGNVMLVHTVINAYLMPDGVSDAEQSDDDEVQTFRADPLWNNASVYWQFEPISGQDGTYYIKSQPNNRYLGLRGGVAKADVNVTLRLNVGNAAQWIPTPIPTLPDVFDRPVVRALRLRGTNFAMAPEANLNRDANIKLDRAWDGVFNHYHAFTLIPASSVVTTP